MGRISLISLLYMYLYICYGYKYKSNCLSSPVFFALEHLPATKVTACTGNWKPSIMNVNKHCYKWYSSVIYHLKGIVSMSELLVHRPFSSCKIFKVVTVYLAASRSDGLPGSCEHPIGPGGVWREARRESAVRSCCQNLVGTTKDGNNNYVSNARYVPGLLRSTYIIYIQSELLLQLSTWSIEAQRYLVLSQFAIQIKSLWRAVLHIKLRISVWFGLFLSVLGPTHKT